MRMDTSWKLVLLLFIAVHVSRVAGRSTGAPAQACSSLSPSQNAHGGLPQTSTVPYEIDVSVFRDAITDQLLYTPATTYQSKNKNLVHLYNAMHDHIATDREI
jgi:hypothetical protein